MASKTTTVIPSLCLPRIYFSFDEAYVENVFVEMFGLAPDGTSPIKQIDLVGREDRRTGEPFWLCFVHFSSEKGVITTPEVEDFVKRIQDGEEVNIQYCYPKKWFWKVRKNNNHSDKNSQKQEKVEQKPRIMPKEEQAELRQQKNIIKKEVEDMKNTKSSTETKKKINWADADDEE